MNLWETGPGSMNSRQKVQECGRLEPLKRLHPVQARGGTFPDAPLEQRMTRMILLAVVLLLLLVAMGLHALDW